MKFLEPIAAAFSMFSAIPMPKTAWKQSALRYLLCAFPLVGVAIGVCWVLWGGVCDWLSFPNLLRGAGLTLIPVLVTGGFHLDGYADTADALCSHATPERKREILKDSRCGAFAIIWLCTLFLATFALCASLKSPAPMFPAFALSRTLSALALTALPLSDGNDLARTFVETSDLRRVRRILLAEAGAAALALLIFGGVAGFVMLGAALAVMARYVYVVRHDFGGVSGDLAGWFLQKAEFWMLAALVFVQYWGGNA